MQYNLYLTKTWSKQQIVLVHMRRASLHWICTLLSIPCCETGFVVDIVWLNIQFLFLLCCMYYYYSTILFNYSEMHFFMYLFELFLIFKKFLCTKIMIWIWVLLAILALFLIGAHYIFYYFIYMDRGFFRELEL